MGRPSIPDLPLDLTALWLAPQSGRAGPQGPPAPGLAAALALIDKGDDAQALAVLSQASVQQGVLGSYAIYYAGERSCGSANRPTRIRTFRLMQQREPVGYLREASALGEAESLEAAASTAGGVIVYKRLTQGTARGAGRHPDAARSRSRGRRRRDARHRSLRARVSTSSR